MQRKGKTLDSNGKPVAQHLAQAPASESVTKSQARDTLGYPHHPSVTHLDGLDVSGAGPPRPARLPRGTLLCLGTSLILGTIALFFGGLWLVLFSSSISDPDSLVLRSIKEDEHYKYLLFLLIPAGLVAVIVNWGGLHYFRHA